MNGWSVHERKDGMWEVVIQHDPEVLLIGPQPAISYKIEAFRTRYNLSDEMVAAFCVLPLRGNHRRKIRDVFSSAVFSSNTLVFLDKADLAIIKLAA